MAYKIVHMFLLMADTMVGLVLSVNQPWITAMKTCANNSQAPFDPGENFEPDKKWTGTVKYHMSIGIVTLKIEKSEDDPLILPILNATIWRNGTYCLPPLSKLSTGTNGYKCTLADFNFISIKDLPTPTHCMMNDGNISQYVSCEDRIDDGCQRIDSNSQLSITLSFTYATNEYCKDEPCEDPPTPTHCMMNEGNSSQYITREKKTDDGCQEINKAVNPEKCCLISLIKQYKFHLIVFVSLVGILVVACICCCGRCQTKRQSIKEDLGHEPVRRPYSENIECIYINRDLSSINDTYEVVTNNTQGTNARLRIVQQNNDMGASRSAKSPSGDYNLAWPGGGWSTTVASTDMNTVPEEEIYSKQKIVWEDGIDAITQPSLDDQTNPEYSNKTGNNHKMVTDGGIKCVEITNSNTLAEAHYSKVVIVNQKQHIDKAGYYKPDDNIYSIVNINGTKHQIKEEEAQGKSEKPLQSIKSDDKSSCLKKSTEANVRALDKLTKIKKTQDKTPPIASIGTTNDLRFKIDNSNTMENENAAVLIGNLRLETKL
uniref:Uncharacterized protein LOC111134487 isoform X2 n=1 Tax=Crassostrea virginica TaxID=6565 RepID=A0A8B8EHZ9_CRAVI|nr:uncharacterized protein LOC111134487 isoform X2 [Crassostrea virginica]